MNWLKEFWVTWGPWISVAVIPTIITGLSKSPSTMAIAQSMQKIWDVVKQTLSYISVTTFKDEPGTFQLPILAAARRTKKLKMLRKMQTQPPPPADGSGPPIGTVLLLLALTLTQNSCCAWSGTCTDKGGKILTDVIDCGRQGVKEAMANLLPTILAIITSGAVNWERQLDSLKVMGVDAVACALVVVSHNLKATAQAAPMGSEEGLKLQVKAKADLQKAEFYLSKNNLKTTGTEQ